MQNIFPLLSKALWLRINSCYSMLFSYLKPKRNIICSWFISLLVDLYTWIPCILGHPHIYIYWDTQYMNDVKLFTKNDKRLDTLVWFGLVLWHISHCRLFKSKSIFIHVNNLILKNSAYKNSSISVLFHAIQFSISTQFQCKKQFYFRQFSLSLV